MASEVQTPQKSRDAGSVGSPDSVEATRYRAGTSEPPPRRSYRKLIGWALIALAGVALLGFFVWRNAFETYHLATVHEGVLYRDGNRGIREFTNAVEQVRPTTVVCLIDQREWDDPKLSHFDDEVYYLKGRKVRGNIPVKFVRLPVKLGGWPTKKDVEDFLTIVKDPKKQPVLVHCAQGVRRTGMMVAAYQEAVLGYTDQQAKDAILTFGHSERTIKDIKTFIDGYDPKTGEVPSGLPSGDE